MTITPAQADRLKRDATAGPWFIHTDPGDIDGTFVYDDTGNMCIAVDHRCSDYREADLALAAAAPDLAKTIAALRWEYGAEQATGVTQWFGSRSMAEAHAEVRGAFRLVRRLVGPKEAIDGD